MINIRKQYFPFAQGIAFKLKNNRYILKELDQDMWQKATNNKDIIVCSNKGLIESYFSLTVVEAIKKKLPKSKIYWCGSEVYKPLVDSNNISKFSNIIKKEHLSNYPIPLFFDEYKKYCIFNLDYNYIDVYSYEGEFRYKDKSSCLSQLFKGSCLPWNEGYVPKFRNVDNDNLEKWSFSYKFDINKPYILIFPDKEELSMCKQDYIGWDIPNIRSFIAMIQNKGLQIVISSKNLPKYYGLRCFFAPTDIISSLKLVEKCKYILSYSPDYILMSIVSNNPIVFCKKNKAMYEPYKNLRFLKVENRLNIFKDLKPIDVFNLI